MDAGDKQFPLPVDSEHKALQIKILSFARPHMRAFHLCWFGFFTSFVSTFAPAAMIPVVRESMDVNADDLANAGAAVQPTFPCPDLPNAPQASFRTLLVSDMFIRSLVHVFELLLPDIASLYCCHAVDSNAAYNTSA